MTQPPEFFNVSGSSAGEIIEEYRSAVFNAIETAYRLHAASDSVNPDSYFLLYPHNPSARIIALPAHLGGTVQKSGIKWISSFPENRAANLARASAVLILNDASNGYPVACMEASVISATRTAASAALAAEHLAPDPFGGTLSIVGTGIIARTTIQWLTYRSWKFDKVCLFDLDREEADRFANWLRNTYGFEVEIKEELHDALREGALALFTTTAPKPYVLDKAVFAHCPTILHLSLRDIGEDIILSSQNVVDDVEHCLKANTSLHLTETMTGNRDFIDGTLVDVLDGRVKPAGDKPRIFSPFGLGVLDIAVGNLVLEKARENGRAILIPEFFSHAERW